MGCGAVCGTQPTTSTKHYFHSQHTLQQLFPKITINHPLLPQRAYRQFCTSLTQTNCIYILPVGPTVPTDEDLPPSIIDKWRIVLYGLSKQDCAYKRCLGFQLRNEKQHPTTRQQKVDNNLPTLQRSYHQIKTYPQYHSCFSQIEKDLNRTFDFQQHTKLLFENVLKRIANHFPSMGYTQGVNFVVGYLLILGYSETDTFWIFAHLAMNMKYLLLGLYEDGFPLANIYTLIFKNMLRRLNYSLFNQIYNTLMLDQSVWIFKWFITYFIYSFPLQIIKYVWDIVIELGGIGLVYFAISLVLHIKSHLMKFQDPCDISEFLQSFKSLTVFNDLVKMDQVVEYVYEIKLCKQDLDGIDKCQPSFYQKHYQLIQLQLQNKNNRANQSHTKSQSKQQELTNYLHLWYTKLLQQRRQFINKSQEQKKPNNSVPQLLKDDWLNMEKSLQLLQAKIIQNQSVRLSQRSNKEIAQKQNYFEQLIIKEPFQIDLTGQIQQIEPQNRSKGFAKMSYDIGQEIDELQGESDSNNSEIQLSQHEHSINKHPSPQPSIHIDGIEEKDQQEHNHGYNINTIISHLDHHRKKHKEGNTKANNIRIDSLQVRSGLTLAGQNILCNFSGTTNSQYSSIESKNASYKPRKQKQNNISRYNKVNKVRTDALSQQSQPSNERSSQRESSIDRKTEKDSLSGLTHKSNPRKDRPTLSKNENYLERKTQQQLMVISLGPEKTLYNGTSKDPVSEIQLFNGQGFFKKKKRTFNRNSIITSITHDMAAGVQIDSTNNIVNPAQIKRLAYNEQESLESILELSRARRPAHSNAEQLDMLCQIESVK